MELQNMFGLTRGKFIGEPPLYVNKSRKPGMTDMPKPTVMTWLRNSPFLLITSPKKIIILLFQRILLSKINH
jgi:hypothetical protein